MKKLLVVIDFQNDFIDGALGFESAKNIEKIIKDKILEYEKNSDDIIFTLDTHRDDYLETIEGKYLPVKHCIKGSFGHELYGEIKELAKNHLIIEKPTFGSFELGEVIKDKGYESIELCGLVSDICVISNAIIAKAASPKSRILVDAKATDSYDKTMQEKAFDMLTNLHIDVINRA